MRAAMCTWFYRDADVLSVTLLRGRSYSRTTGCLTRPAVSHSSVLVGMVQKQFKDIAASKRQDE
jgi:hypothetical protein